MGLFRFLSHRLVRDRVLSWDVGRPVHLLCPCFGRGTTLSDRCKTKLVTAPGDCGLSVTLGYFR